MMDAMDVVDKLSKSKFPQAHEVDEVMQSLWVSFHAYLGLPCEENPEPYSGYKFEPDVLRRDEFLGKAIRMRNKYAALVSRFGKGRENLAQMTFFLSKLQID